MAHPESSPLDRAYSYHERTKHHLNRYARSSGYLDWASQPNPFRRYNGSPLTRLGIPDEPQYPSYDRLFSLPPINPAPLDAASLSNLFFYSLSLSAWKQVTTRTGKVQSRWSLRVNPSSGNLHPTEAYLAGGPSPGIYHYTAFEHALELRRQLHNWPAPDTLLIGLTSIHWRESWKYGERAFRYCQHDVGHAIGAITIAAAALGWQTQLVDSITTRQLSEFLGITDQFGDEAEHADCLLSLAPGIPSRLDLTTIRGSDWTGIPNQLSLSHVPWTVIDDVSAATESPGFLWPPVPKPRIPCQLPDRNIPAARILRQRRSAVAMDGTTTIDRDTFFRMIARTVPALAPMPFRVLPWRPTVSLALFVHRVSGLTPGVYALVRDPDHEQSLRNSMRSEFLWERADEAPDSLPLYLLLPAGVTDAAKTISCHQDIASDGVFSAGMLAKFDATLKNLGSAMYPRMFWETGLIGQLLYLEAEAAGIRATGIGCFFDDACHHLLGIRDHSWQSLYHFTIGGPVEDSRLQTIDAYEHLKVRAAHGDDSWPEG